MMDQEINEAIAVSLGWVQFREEEYPHRTLWREGEVGSRVWDGPYDYCEDLNAMHEAEVSLSEAEYRAFFYQLHKLRNDDCLPICKCISAPARQRAEAYLRVKGLWQESTSAATKGM